MATIAVFQPRVNITSLTGVPTLVESPSPSPPRRPPKYLKGRRKMLVSRSYCSVMRIEAILATRQAEVELRPRIDRRRHSDVHEIHRKQEQWNRDEHTAGDIGKQGDDQPVGSRDEQ